MNKVMSDNVQAKQPSVTFDGLDAHKLVTFSEDDSDIDWVIPSPATVPQKRAIVPLNQALSRSDTRRRRAITIRHPHGNMQRNITDVVAQSLGVLSAEPGRTVGVFGQIMKFSDIDNLVRRDPIAYRIWSMRSDDPFNKWNVVRSDSQLFTELLSQKLEMLQWRQAFNTAWSYAIKYCFGIMVKLYDNETYGHDLSGPVPNNAQLTRINPVSPKVVSRFNYVTDLNSEDYMTLETLDIMLGTQPKTIHASRIFQTVNPAPDGDPRGMSVFEPIWDDFTYKKNQDIALAETVVANVRQLPVFWFDDVDDDEMEDIQTELEDIRAMDTALTLRGAGPNSKIQEILGAGALNPTPYTEYNLQNISAGSGVPMHVLLDTPAGALVASNENVKNYLSRVSNDQTKNLEPIHVSLIQELISRGQLPLANFSIEWLPIEEITFAEKSQAVMRANLGLLNMAKGLETLIDPEGGVGIPFDRNAYELVPTEFGSFELAPKPETEPEQYYQTERIEPPKTSAVITSAEFRDVLLSMDTLQKIYDQEFLVRHITDIVTRVTWFARQEGLTVEERAIRPPDVLHFFNNVLSQEHRYMRYMTYIDSLKDGGVTTIQIEGDCPECDKLGVYNVYRTNSTTLPLLPMHGKHCTFRIKPY